MKTVILVLIFVSWNVMSVYAVERKPAVMIHFVDGSEQRFRLDHVDESHIIVLKSGFQKKLVFSRAEITWMRFRPEISAKIPEGEEIVVLADGSIVNGSPVWMDERDFWIEAGDHKRKRFEHKKVTFIQFANSKDAVRISAASPGAITSRVNVSAERNWTNSNLTVKKGQQIWFTVGDYSVSNCGNPAQEVSANGLPNSFNESSPLSSANFCSLIGKIGQETKPFSIGSQKTPITAETSGKLYLGVNDNSYKDNAGGFDVFVKVASSTETSEPSRNSAPEKKDASNDH